MSCDSQFCQIEQNIRKQYNDIFYTEDDYRTAITIGCLERFSDIKMKPLDFLDFDVSQNCVVNQKGKDVKSADFPKSIYDCEHKDGNFNRLLKLFI